MTMRVRKPLIAFSAILQSVLWLTHLFLYATWTFGETHGAPWIKLVFGLLSVSFIVASLLALRYPNAAVRAFYRIAVRCCGGGWTLRGFQCELDADHPNDSAPREAPGGVARAKSGADQRCAPRARAKRHLFAAHGGEACEG